MNVNDVVKYGHFTVMRAVEGLDDLYWETTGVCGNWSVKEIIAHLASYENMLIDILRGFGAGGETPTLNRMLELGDSFNDHEVLARDTLSAKEVWQEYLTAQAESAQLLATLSTDTLRKTGSLPWYGADYDLEDFIVYTFYGHKREHCAQIDAFRSRLTML